MSALTQRLERVLDHPELNPEMDARYQSKAFSKSSSAINHQVVTSPEGKVGTEVGTEVLFL